MESGKEESGITAFELPAFPRVVWIQERQRGPSDIVFISLSHGTERLGLKPSKKLAISTFYIWVNHLVRGLASVFGQGPVHIQ